MLCLFPKTRINLQVNLFWFVFVSLVELIKGSLRLRSRPYLDSLPVVLLCTKPQHLNFTVSAERRFGHLVQDGNLEQMYCDFI